MLPSCSQHVPYQNSVTVYNTLILFYSVSIKVSICVCVCVYGRTVFPVRSVHTAVAEVLVRVPANQSLLGIVVH